MSPEAQRIAIAEACGAKNIRFWDNPISGTVVADFPGWWRRVLPDYLNDLNAMAEAEKAGEIDRCHWQKYEHELKCIRGTRWGIATAAQRAEAFLRTVGKWKESP